MMIHLCNFGDIAEGSSRGFRLNGTALFAVRKQGQLHLYRNRCPHLGAELEWQEHDFLDPAGQHIRCANHGALFAIESGECLQGPCLGQHLQSISYQRSGERILLDETKLRLMA